MGRAARLINPLDHLKILTEIAPVLVGHRLRPAIPALISSTGIIAHAIQTHPKIVPALETLFSAARLPRKLPLTSAMMAMTCHEVILTKSNRQINAGAMPGEPGKQLDH
jgi:hypothetical protein